MACSTASKLEDNIPRPHANLLVENKRKHQMLCLGRFSQKLVTSVERKKIRAEKSDKKFENYDEGKENNGIKGEEEKREDKKLGK